MTTVYCKRCGIRLTEVEQTQDGGGGVCDMCWIEARFPETRFPKTPLVADHQGKDITDKTLDGWDTVKFTCGVILIGFFIVFISYWIGKLVGAV